MFNNARVLVVVAHPDDELLGQGGTINKLTRENNCIVRAVILGEGITSRSEERNAEKWKSELEQHRSNIQLAVECIGYESVGIYDFPDNRFDGVELLDLVKIVEREKDSFKPEVIFTHHVGDLNIDHQRTFEAVMTATRPMKEEMVRSIVSFETPSSTEWQSAQHPNLFVPNVFVKLSKQNIEAKVKGMESYEFEKREYPHPRSPESLRNRARYWGNCVGAEYAEPFILTRSIH